MIDQDPPQQEPVEMFESIHETLLQGQIPDTQTFLSANMRFTPDQKEQLIEILNDKRGAGTGDVLAAVMGYGYSAAEHRYLPSFETISTALDKGEGINGAELIDLAMGLNPAQKAELLGSIREKLGEGGFSKELLDDMYGIISRIRNPLSVAMPPEVYDHTTTQKRRWFDPRRLLPQKGNS